MYTVVHLYILYSTFWLDKYFYFDSVQKHICAIIRIDKCICRENFILFQLKMYSYMTLLRVNKYLYKICTMNYVTSTFLHINFVLLQMNFYMATFVRFVFGLQESALTKMCTDIMHFIRISFTYSITLIYNILCINVSHI